MGVCQHWESSLSLPRSLGVCGPRRGIVMRIGRGELSRRTSAACSTTARRVSCIRLLSLNVMKVREVVSHPACVAWLPCVTVCTSVLLWCVRYCREVNTPPYSTMHGDLYKLAHGTDRHASAAGPIHVCEQYACTAHGSIHRFCAVKTLWHHVCSP